MGNSRRIISGLDYLPHQPGQSVWFLLIATGLLAWLLSTLGLFHFFLWEQVEYLGNRDVSAWEMVVKLHPHALRYLLVRPVYWVESHFGVSRNEFYNLLVSFLLLLLPLYVYFCLIRLGVAKKRTLLVSLLCLLVYVVLGTFMHGRIIWAHAGILLVITAPLFHAEKFLSAVWFLFQLLVALLMASVSSGTLLVAYLSVIVMAGIYSKHSLDIKRIHYARIIPIIVALLVFLPWVIVGTFKNVGFYGGGLEGVAEMTTSHGTLSTLKACAQEKCSQHINNGQPPDDRHEKFLETYREYMLFLSFLPILIFLGLFFYSRRQHLKLNISISWISMLLTVLIGQLGYATLTLAIPLLMLLIAVDPFQNYPRE